MNANDGPVLLATDFSPEARRAYPVAAEYARAAGAPLVLLHVHQSLTEPSSPGDFASELGESEERLALELAELGGGDEQSAFAMAATHVARGIARHADEVGARCIVLSTHGHSGVRHLVLGSTAEGVARHAHVPVITVPPPLEDSAS